MDTKEIPKIAVLLTCHNRKEKTLKSLDALHKCDVLVGYIFDVFLVDDGSTDDTGDAVREKYPKVNVIQGEGDLFWNGGMRLAWNVSADTKDYDFYFWLNDDTILDESAFLEIFETYQEARSREKNEVIIVSACRAENNSSRFSYGGRDKQGPVIPNGELQTCKFINGNAALIPREVFENLGNLSSDYTHGIGDNDYGLRALRHGYICYTTKEFVATCPPNEGLPDWCNPEVSLRKRWQLLHEPIGLNIKEYITYKKKHDDKKWIIFALKAYLKALFPKLYYKCKNILR
jgi:GT2 family glycosyltransferase